MRIACTVASKGVTNVPKVNSAISTNVGEKEFNEITACKHCLALFFRDFLFNRCGFCYR